MHTALKTLCSTAMLFSLIPAAYAHVGFKADNEYGGYSAVSGTTYYATMNLGHGCEDNTEKHYDTIKIEVTIPNEINGVPTNISDVRPMDASFAQASVEKDNTGKVTKLIWTKNAAGAADDDFLYQVQFRMKLYETLNEQKVFVKPLTVLEFPTTQTCTGDTTISWEGEDVPKLLVQQARKPGWNKYTAQNDISLDTIKKFFVDASIVWANNAAYSSNPATYDLIKNRLDAIPAGTEYWVKY